MPQGNVTGSALLTDADIEYVNELVRRAGQLAAGMRDGVGISQKTGPQDLVTEADIELSRLIMSHLRERFPGDVIISEEEPHPKDCGTEGRVWLVDPIDGTDNYVRNDGQYAVMVGFLQDGQAAFGWVYAPALDTTYFGGPGSRSWEQTGTQRPRQLDFAPAMTPDAGARVMMGFRDRKSHPWVNELPGIEWVKSGSVGLKVAKILVGQADVFIHLSGKLKVWDTAGPVAIALGAGLEVGQLERDGLEFPLPEIQHHCSVIIGRAGALAWSRACLLRTES